MKFFFVKKDKQFQQWRLVFPNCATASRPPRGVANSQFHLNLELRFAIGTNRENIISSESVAYPTAFVVSSSASYLQEWSVFGDWAIAGDQVGDRRKQLR